MHICFESVIHANFECIAPLFQELRLLLANGAEPLLNRNNVSKSNPVNAKSLRKITPVHNPKSFQLSDQGSSFGLCDVSNLADNHIQVKLQVCPWFNLLSLAQNFYAH